MHKMSQHMQNTIAQHPQRREKVTWDPQEQDSTAKRRRLRPSRARVNFSPQRNLRWPKKTQCFVQIVTLRLHPWCSSSTTKHDQNRKTRLQNKHHSSLGATIPLRSAQTELHSRIELQHSTVNNIALHPFQCTKWVSAHAKNNSTASTNKRKSHLGPSATLRAHFEQDSTAKRRRLRLSGAGAYFSPQRNLRWPKENTMFRYVSCKS